MAKLRRSQRLPGGRAPRRVSTVRVDFWAVGPGRADAAVDERSRRAAHRSARRARGAARGATAHFGALSEAVARCAHVESDGRAAEIGLAVRDTEGLRVDVQHGAAARRIGRVGARLVHASSEALLERTHAKEVALLFFALVELGVFELALFVCRFRFILLRVRVSSCYSCGGGRTGICMDAHTAINRRILGGRVSKASGETW